MQSPSTSRPSHESELAADARSQLLRGIPISDLRHELAGIPTAVLEGGAGSPIVLLHGPGEHAAKWLRVIPELVQSHRVIAPDLPGHGASASDTGPFDPGRVMAWLGELIERTCATPPVLVGTTLGAAIAAHFASEHPGRIRRLVLVDAFGLAPFQPTPEFAAALTEFMARPSPESHERLWRHCAHNLDSLRAGLGERWKWFESYNLDRARARAGAPTNGSKHPLESLMELFGLPAIDDARLASITTWTTLIWGRHDLATSLHFAQAASARHGWPLRVIEDAGDDPPVEQPAAFLRHLQAAIVDPPDAWSEIAADYDRTNTSSQMWLASEALRRTRLRPGDRFLDVAAGSGALSVPAARMGADVLAIDQSPTMLELLRERGQRERLAIETRVMDGHELVLDSRSFDVTGSQFGVMLFPDVSKAIREMARVTKPGGRVLIVAYGDPHAIDFLGFFVRAIQSVRPDFDGPPGDPPPLPFQLQDPRRIHQELASAGLVDVAVETITETTEFEDGKSLFRWTISSNPIVESLLSELGITSAERDRIEQALSELVRERAGAASTAKLSNPVNIGIGTKR